MTIHPYWFAYQGLVVKQVRRFMRSWIQSLMPSLITAGLFLLIFGHLVGRELGPMGGVDYAAFILPGLIMLAVITNAYNNCSLAFFGAKLQRHIEELLVAPVPAWLIVAGFVTAGVLRGLLAGAAVTALAVPVAGLPVERPGLGLLMATLTATVFAFAGLINGLFARRFEDTNVIATFVLTPLIYLGGVFYTLDRLPSPWDSLAGFNPLYLIIGGFREALLTHGDGTGSTLIVLAVGVALTGATAWGLVARGVRLRP